MLKKTLTYTDFEGNQRTEDFYFNLSKAEVVKMEAGISGGMSGMLRRIVAAQDTKLIMEVFEDIVIKSYGEKSPDGRRFIKSKELSEAFLQTEAYSDLFMSFISDGTSAADFINAIMPKMD